MLRFVLVTTTLDRVGHVQSTRWLDGSVASPARTLTKLFGLVFVLTMDRDLEGSPFDRRQGDYFRRADKHGHRRTSLEEERTFVYEQAAIDLDGASRKMGNVTQARVEQSALNAGIHRHRLERQALYLCHSLVQWRAGGGARFILAVELELPPSLCARAISGRLDHFVIEAKFAFSKPGMRGSDCGGDSLLYCIQYADRGAHEEECGSPRSALPPHTIRPPSLLLSTLALRL